MTDAPARNNDGLYRLAGYCLFAALITLLVAAIALATFFSDTEGMAIFGPINDIFTALTLALIAPAVVAVRRLAADRVGNWFGVLSIATLAGLAVAIAGFLLLVIGMIDLQASFVTLGVGLLPFLAWVAALGYLALGAGVLSRAVGWWTVAFVGATMLAIVAMPLLPIALLSLTLAPLLVVALAGWMVVLGRDLLRRANG